MTTKEDLAFAEAVRRIMYFTTLVKHVAAGGPNVTDDEIAKVASLTEPLVATITAILDAEKERAAAKARANAAEGTPTSPNADGGTGSGVPSHPDFPKNPEGTPPHKISDRLMPEQRRAKIFEVVPGGFGPSEKISGNSRGGGDAA